MKFSCDRCGKKYATAEAPAPGRVYKLKCKACGHVIVVKTPASAPTVTPGSGDEAIAARVSSAALPAAQPEAEQPPAAQFQFPAATPPPANAGEPTQELSMVSQTQSREIPFEAAAPPPPEEPLPEPPKPQDGGYVDIFADSAPQAPPPREEVDDPFLKAARGSLPDHFGAAPSLPDPFADMREELVSAPASEATPEPARPQVPAPFAPPPPRAPEKKKSGLPVALIGVGVAAVLAIVIGVALTSGKKVEPPRPPPPPPVATPAPAPPPPPAPEPEPKKTEIAKPEPKPEPKKAEPVAARKDDKKAEQARLDAERRREEARLEAERKREADRKREEDRKAEVERKREQARLEAERKREADRKREEDRKAEAERKRLAKAEAAKPKEAEKSVQLPDAASALSPEAVQKVVNGSRRAFETCIVEAAKKGTDTKFDGRKVALRLNVNPNGFVTYPTLDDVTLNRTDLGECLKAAARLMVFPKFQGDVFHVEVPLTLRGG